MSDPAKSASEIEDVLASIRRLVSENHGSSPAAPSPVRLGVPGPLRDPVGATPASPDGGASVGKLVLTPALRVTDPDDPWAPVPQTTQDADAVKDDAGDGVSPDDDPAWGLEDRLSDWGEIEDSAEEAVADAIADQEAEAPFRMGATGDRLAELDDEDGMVAEFEPETGDTDWPDGSAGQTLKELALVRGRVHVETEPGAEPAGGDPQVAAPADDARDDPAAAVIQARQALHDPDVAPEEADSPMTPDDEHERPTEAAADAEAHPEAAVADAGFTPIFSRRPAVHRAGAPETSMDENGDEIEDLGEAPSPFTFPEAAEGILDEETLRDIIAEVVREELQGAMGQRITRNVRKMVRREIRLALAAEDLE